MSRETRFAGCAQLYASRKVDFTNECDVPNVQVIQRMSRAEAVTILSSDMQASVLARLESLLSGLDRPRPPAVSVE